MISQQTPYTIPPIEERPPTPPQSLPRQAVPEYNEQYTELLAQRLIPRLMPEILYHLRAVDPARERNRAFGMSLALAIVSVALLIPLTAIVLGIVTTLGGGITPALVGISVSGQVVLTSNTGSVQASGGTLSGNSQLITNTGSITFSGSLSQMGTYQFQTNTGSVDVTIPGTSVFHVDASTDTG